MVSDDDAFSTMLFSQHIFLVTESGKEKRISMVLSIRQCAKHVLSEETIGIRGDTSSRP